jgi:hypothetical protein
MSNDTEAEPDDVVTRTVNEVVAEFDIAICNAIDAAVAAGLSRIFLMGTLHGHALTQTLSMVGKA